MTTDNYYYYSRSLDLFFLSTLMIDSVQFKLSNTWRPVSAIKVQCGAVCVRCMQPFTTIETNAIIIIMKMAYPLSWMYDVCDAHNCITQQNNRKTSLNESMNEWMNSLCYIGSVQCAMQLLKIDKNIQRSKERIICCSVCDTVPMATVITTAASEPMGK